jgi:hypothetical protein
VSASNVALTLRLCWRRRLIGRCVELQVPPSELKQEGLTCSDITGRLLMAGFTVSTVGAAASSGFSISDQWKVEGLWWERDRSGIAG